MHDYLTDIRTAHEQAFKSARLTGSRIPALLEFIDDSIAQMEYQIEDAPRTDVERISRLLIVAQAYRRSVGALLTETLDPKAVHMGYAVL